MITLEKIEALNGIKIFAMSKNQIMKLMQGFPPMMKMIGIPAISDKKESIQVLQTVELLLLDSFSDLSDAEINYAFLQYSAGHIEISKDDKHFGLWNLKFIGAVLSEYRKIKHSLIARKTESQYIDQTKQLGGKSLFEQGKEDYVSLLEFVKAEQKIPPQGNFYKCFQYLDAIGRFNFNKKEYIPIVNGIINQ
jgi:hypothetical protein